MNGFELILTGYISENHPNLIDKEDFIKERADRAAEEFEKASKSGKNVEEAMYYARTVLFEGLHFSPYLFVREIIEKDFEQYTDEDEIDEFTMVILENYMSVIEAKNPNDDFENSNEYHELYEEMKNIINKHLIQNGIQ